MITANDARGMMNYEKAMNFIDKNIRAAALEGKTEYTYTTDYKAKASKIVSELKALGYDVRFIHTPNGVREHKIVARW